MDKIKIVYIDDDPDEAISKYLGTKYKHDNFDDDYEEITFKSEEGYDDLICNPVVTEANIILIDSKLFENNVVTSGKFSGEEFKIIFKKMFPFIEVLVITQNHDLGEEYGIIQKYRKGLGRDHHQYYSIQLKKSLDEAIKNIQIYRNISDKLKHNEGIDKVLIEKIISSLDGKSQYDELNKNDIDEIIKTFQELQRELSE